MNEFVIEWISGQNTASVTFPSNSRWAGKIRKLAQESPSVDVIADANGALFAHIPVSYLSIRKPRELSEEQKAKARANLERIRNEG